VRVFLWRGISNSHDALWLTNSPTEMFSVYAVVNTSVTGHVNICCYRFSVYCGVDFVGSV